jgi:hypothetical protein
MRDVKRAILGELGRNSGFSSGSIATTFCRAPASCRPTLNVVHTSWQKSGIFHESPDPFDTVMKTTRGECWDP